LISNYLKVLDATHVVQVVRPFSRRRTSEIVSAPKVYGFDTGFVCYHRGWDKLRSDDCGYLWEHYVLNEMRGVLQTRRIHYWRDKRGHEIDFVYLPRGGQPTAIECKWSANGFDAKGILAFRRKYAGGDNYVVVADVDRAFSRNIMGARVQFVGLEGLMTKLKAAASPPP